MKFAKLALASLLVLALSATAWAEEVVINGSTTVLPIMQKVAEAYMGMHKDVTLSVSGGGSGNGIKAIIDGTTNIAMASRQMKDKEVALAKEKGVKNGDKVRVESARGKLECVAMVTPRFRPFMVNGKTLHQVGMPYNYGWRFPEGNGDSANLLTPTVGDANAMTPEYKAFMVNVVKV